MELDYLESLVAQLNKYKEVIFVYREWYCKIQESDGGYDYSLFDEMPAEDSIDGGLVETDSEKEAIEEVISMVDYKEEL